MTEPDRRADCDIVMRGGITSGLVYPSAIAELATHWHFRNIGGASAGAIAAGILAAAEFGRRRGTNPASFDAMKAIPSQMGGGRLKALFPASPGLEPAMALLWSWLATPEKDRTLANFAFVRLRRLVVLPLIAAGTIGIMMMLVGWSFGIAGVAFGWAMFIFLFGALLLIGAELLELYRVARTARETFLTAGAGLSSGIKHDWQSGSAKLGPDRALLEAEGGFADWIHAFIQRVAGRTDNEPPLTVGDLWTADNPRTPDPWDPVRDIDLLLTTSNLTQAVPASFPFIERSGTALYFLEDDLLSVLPAAVVLHLVTMADPVFDRQVDGKTFRRLPLPHHLPIALGVRLSLSFPGLISAVRLHIPCPTNAAEAEWPLVPVLFSDGGITSNFPVTTFDSALPTRPTLCINLADMADHQQGQNTDPIIDLPKDNADGLTIPFRTRPDSGLLSFASAIIDTARNGRENELMAMAGQRDRIVTVLLDPTCQGGLNLDMDQQTINKLAAAGVAAAKALNARFAAPPGAPLAPGWANHRWVRLRTTLAALEAYGTSFAGGWYTSSQNGLSYAALEAKYTVRGAPAYRFTAKALHERALRWAVHFAAEFQSFNAAEPGRPRDSVMNGSQKKGSALSRDRNAAPRPGARLALQPNQGRDPQKG